MHVIKDLEGFLKRIEETVAHYFGKDEAGVVGYKAIKAVIEEHTVTSVPVEIQPTPPVDNEHVAEGATQFTEVEIAADVPEEVNPSKLWQ